MADTETLLQNTLLCPDRYAVGGPVQAEEGGVYIVRKADEEMLALCRDRRYVTMFSSRQVGKTSLINRAAQILEEENFRCIKVDLQGLGTERAEDATSSARQWYGGVLSQVADTLNLKINLSEWWQNQGDISVNQCFTKFFLSVVLPQVEENIVIFIDEIDILLALEHRDQFILVLRHLFNKRDDTPVLRRLSFVLVGVIRASDLIQTKDFTPYNIPKSIVLTDFTLEEAQGLSAGLGLPSQEATQVLKRVLDWTGGQPILTLIFCAEIAKSPRRQWTPADLEGLAREIFLTGRSETNMHLTPVRDLLTSRVPEKYQADVLSIYQRVRLGKSVKDDDKSVAISYLRLSGIVRSRNNLLEVRNRVYWEVFNLQWIRAHRVPAVVRAYRHGLLRAALIAGPIISLLIFAATFIFLSRRSVQEANAKANRFLYVTKINLAKQAWDNQNVDRMQQLLDDAAQRNVDGEDLRGFEWYYLSGLAHTPLKPLRGHADKVMSVAFSSDGSRLATGSRDGTTILWDETTTKPIRTFAERTKSPVNVVAFSRENTLLATGSDNGTVSLWNVESGKLLWQKQSEQQGAVKALAFSSNGRFLLTGGDDGRIKEWNLTSGQQQSSLWASRVPFMKSRATITSLALSPDGNQLAIGTRQNYMAWLWNVNAKQPLRLEGHRDYVYCVAFLQGGKKLATGDNAGHIIVYETQTGKQSPDWLLDQGTGKVPVNALAFSSDGATLATGAGEKQGGSEPMVKLWNVDTRVVQRALPETDPIYSVAFSPNGKTLAIGGWRKAGNEKEAAWLWKVADPAEETRVPTPPSKVVFSPDGSWQASCEEETILLVNKDSRQARRTLKVHNDPVTSLAFSPRGEWLASGSEDKTAVLSNMETGSSLPALQGHRGPVKAVAFSRDGRTLATGSADGTVKLWNVATQQEMMTFVWREHQISSVDFPDNRTLTAGDSQTNRQIAWKIPAPENPPTY